jgi:hypothetical protein
MSSGKWRITMQRDQFLTEKVFGECWHEDGIGECEKCHRSFGAYRQNDFSSWPGFGKLWEAAQKDEGWLGFVTGIIEHKPSGIVRARLLVKMVNPDRFADAWAKFKGWKEDTDANTGKLPSMVADRIISLLDKQVQEAGWVVPVVMPRALEKDEEITMPATHEDVISGKAVRR